MRKIPLEKKLWNFYGTEVVYRPELHSHGECRNRDIAYSIAQGELEYYRILEATGWSKILTTSRDINSHIKLSLIACTCFLHCFV